MKYDFFKPTPKFKEYQLLTTIENTPKLTQREIAKAIETSVSMVNFYLTQYESNGLVSKKINSKKNVVYEITERGSEERKMLSVGILRASLKIHNTARANIIPYFNKIISQGFKNVYFYGAGEVCELFLELIKLDNVELNVLGLIDDNKDLVGKDILGTKIHSNEVLKDNKFDAVVITSYKNKQSIIFKLHNLGVSDDMIIKPYLEDKFI